MHVDQKLEVYVTQPKRLLFVCLGNIVRSPLAEKMFAHLASQAGMGDNFEVDSAGTAGYHVGEAPDSRMRAVGAEKGLVYSGQARQFSENDFQDFDLILAMDQNNYNNILALAGSPNDQRKVHMMREFDPQANPYDGVPDPYYDGIEGFYSVYEIVERSCQGLLDAIKAGKL